jgi:hypothetical protein
VLGEPEVLGAPGATGEPAVPGRAVVPGTDGITRTRSSGVPGPGAGCAEASVVLVSDSGMTGALIGDLVVEATPTAPTISAVARPGAGSSATVRATTGASSIVPSTRDVVGRAGYRRSAPSAIGGSAVDGPARTARGGASPAAVGDGVGIGRVLVRVSAVRAASTGASARGSSPASGVPEGVGTCEEREGCGARVST